MAEPVRMKRPASYADILAAPPDVVAEIVAGTLYTSPRPGVPHAFAATALSAVLGGPFGWGTGGGPGGWVFLLEPELHLRGDVLVPDLAAWRRERMPKLPRAAALELAPDWVCEVLSPSTAALDRVRKLPRYAAAGVGHAWVLDPLARTLEVLRLGPAAHYELVGAFGEDDGVVAASPFEAVPIALGALWEAVEGEP
jgi:hypothetical protein